MELSFDAGFLKNNFLKYIYYLDNFYKKYIIC
jgi:hypothetical protein